LYKDKRQNKEQALTSSRMMQ